MAAVATVPEWMEGERRRPTPSAMLGAIGGLVVLGGLVALSGELPDEHERIAGLALALLALIVGNVLGFIDREGGAAHVAGVVLAAGAVFPLATLVAAGPEDFERTDALVTGLLAAVIWVVLFVAGPARGHGLFLGLTLAALWLAALSQTGPPSLFFWDVGASSGRVETSVTTEAPVVEPPAITVPDFSTRPMPTFTIPVPPEPSFTFPPPEPAPFPTPTFRFPSPSTTTGTSTTTSTTSTTAAAPEQALGRVQPASFTQDDDIEEPIAAGVVSLLFGMAYLAAAVVLDAARLRRLASAFVVVGSVALLSGNVGFAPRYGSVGGGLIALAVGAAFVAVGLAGARRLLAWLGALVAAVGVGVVVADRFDDPGAGAAVALLLVGAAIVGTGVVIRPPAPPASG